MGFKSAQRHFVTTVAGVDGTFETKTGGDLSADASKVFDGGARTPDVMMGPREVADVTVGRTFDRFRDGELLAKLRTMVGEWTTTVSVQPTDAKMIAYGKPTVYSNAALTGLREFEVDANSGEPSKFELTFACPDVV